MPTVSVNTHFPGYEIIGELGRSNARVLKARHLASGNLVAIKHFTLNTDADTLRRFRIESEIMTSIRHPNVVRVREVQLDMPMPFIVMEWVEGGNLRSLIDEQGQLSVAATIRLGLQMSEAFHAIHPQGIIHRDIKPENILYRFLPSGELHFLLTDFGVARLREQSQTMTGQSLMTYEYASPEQFDNPKGVDLATDYYSLGVVFYECLAGKVPFAMADTAGMATFMGHVLRTPPPALSLPSGQFLPPSLNVLLNWTLVKNPADRLSDVTELALLLGQANVELLQANRSGNRQAPSLPRAQTMAAPAVPQSVDAYEPLHDDEPSGSSGSWKIALSAFVITLLIGLAIMYSIRHKDKPASFLPDSTVTDTDSLASDELVPNADSATVTFPESDEETTTDSVATSPAPIPPANTTTATPTTPSDSTATPDSTGNPN
ncbi:serine/threonine-protein kinase [Spirosoma pollinicola]|uniref:non-specific serine/threonine protein kinase n=1 Tax=Spirosoma pollinicola TaxID=2057025 RepID=A0A2K8YVC2_9BACT|nr:serine/threonine-protein kinase [Spirosoma pollinicola]AUD01566.1 serine/threonine protein kinase [Spirosoma pollinicola]